MPEYNIYVLNKNNTSIKCICLISYISNFDNSILK